MTEPEFVELTDLDDDQIQVIVMNGLAILSIRWGSEVTDILRDLLVEIMESEMHKPVGLDGNFPTDNDPED